MQGGLGPWRRPVGVGVVASVVAVLAAACASGPAASPKDAPAAAAAVGPAFEARPAQAWRGGAMIAAANPYAVEAGLEVLRAGGSAVDAAVAVQTVLGLVEPQSSGIGGGAFMVHYDAATGDVVAYDGREVAPAGASPEMFLGEDAKPLRFMEAVTSGRSTGVPGVVAMLAMAHGEHGRRPWGELFDPAIRLAEDGFAVPPRLAKILAQWSRSPWMQPDTAGYLMLDGRTPPPQGHRLRNAAYADTLRRIAAEGPRGFYAGPVAEAIVAAVARAPRPGTLTLADLEGYRASRHEPVCRPYRAYLACGMGPPSSGGIAVLATLGILENFDVSAGGAPSVQPWHHFIEAQRLAYADRDVYVADARFVEVPIAGLLDRDYLASRAALVQPDRAMPKVEAGDPPGAMRRGADAGDFEGGTTHFVIVDARGSVVSMTSTVESIFGSQRLAAGFFLNNQLTDFSFRTVDDRGQPIANAPAARKKPRSSMSPTIVFRDGAFHLAVGSPGGNAIIAYVSKALLGMLDFGLSPQEAIELPNVIARSNVVVEKSRMDPALVQALATMGHAIREGSGGEESGLHAVMVGADGRLLGAADSRRDGVARAP